MTYIGKKAKLNHPTHSKHGEEGIIIENPTATDPRCLNIKFNIDGSNYLGWFTHHFYDAQIEIIEEKFVLPEKWCIKFKNQRQLDDINKHFNKTWNIGWRSQNPLQYKNSFALNDGTYVSYLDPKPKYTEITFEQFKKYVLKMDDKKIIGYKLVKPEYLAATEHIIPWSGKDFMLHSNCHKAFLKAGVLDLWFEPVYEPVEEDIFIGQYKIEVTTKQINFRNLPGDLIWQYTPGKINELYKTMQFFDSEAVFIKVKDENIEVDFETIEKIYKRINK